MVPVLTAAESRRLDEATIDAGTPSFELMRQAGTRLAHLLVSGIPDPRSLRVLVVVGPGNNGGDGWVAAAVLSAAGCQVAVRGAPPRTPDALAAKSMLSSELPTSIENPHLVLDALLGTGTELPLRPSIRELLVALDCPGARRVAVDLPTGLDATTGAADPETRPADLTVTFGAWKRGQLLRRDLVGELVCLDIGLGQAGPVPHAVDPASVRPRVPVITALANKGDRKRLLVVGGAPGMAGATAYAARGAFRSGIGMVRCAVDPVSVGALNALCPQATSIGCNLPAELGAQIAWPHALVIGPGLGTHASRARVTAWLEAWRGPVVLDADALTAFEGDPEGLRLALGGRATVLSPHATEAARLLGLDPEAVRRDPFESARRLHEVTGATVLLKGVPTLVVGTSGTVVVPRGTPALGTGGSGDLLSGIVGTLLAQTGNAEDAAVAGAFVHGLAAEMAAPPGRVRGCTLDDVAGRLPDAWSALRAAKPEKHPVLGRLPSVGERD